MRVLGWAQAGLVAVAVAAWVGFRRGVLLQKPAVFAALVAAVVAACAVQGLVAAARLRRPEAVRRGAVAALNLGLAVAGVAGLLNWALGLQGFVVLTEGESVSLRGGAQLQAFEKGPLASLAETDLTVELVKVRLAAAAEGRFLPRSALRLTRPGETARELEVGPGRAGEAGALRLHQGAFGFRPRLVVTRGDRVVLDQSVPFTTERRGPDGVSFGAELVVQSEGLEVEGAVSLDDLDERMKGHPRLAVRVAKAGRPLGSGELLPGHFADLEDGYRVGFAGLKRWSEIDVSRRSYRGPAVAGLLVAALGAVLWPLAAWRRW